MMTRLLSALIISVVALALDSVHNPASAAGARPNIIVILADDMGWGDTRVMNPEAKIIMPHLERLAAEGMSFSNAHATPKCAPTRSSLMLGGYHSRGRYSWGAWEYVGGSQFLPGQLTLASALQGVGYNTAVVGKWHLGVHFHIKNSNALATTATPEADIDFERGVQNGPSTVGFDYSYIALRGIQAPPYAYFENDQLVGDADNLIHWAKGSYGNSQISLPGIGMPDWDSSQVGPILTQQAISFIDGHHQQNQANGDDKPFFLYYPSQAPHGPVTPPDLFLGEPVKGVTGMGKRTDMVYELDVALGKLEEALEQRGLLENTLLVFVSDNGAPAFRGPLEETFNHAANGTLSGAKGDILEGGHRVPLVMKWGDGSSAGSVIAPGARSTQLVAVQDLFATLGAVVGISLASDQAADSFSFLPALLGQPDSNSPPRDYLIQEARNFFDNQVLPHYSITDNAGWKLFFNNNAEAVALIDLESDPGESTNLIDDPGQAARLSRMTERFLKLAVAQRSAPLLLNKTPPLKNLGAIQPGSGEGVYLWKDSFDGPYFLIVNGPGFEAEYDIELLSSQSLQAVAGYSIETDDILAWQHNRFFLRSKVSSWVDAMGFMLPPRSSALLTLTNNAGNQQTPLYSGASDHRLQRSGWRLKMSELPDLPEYTPGVSLGLYLGKTATQQLSTRWSGDGLPQQLEMTLTYSSANPSVAASEFEAATDSLISNEYSSRIVAQATQQQDVVDVNSSDPNAELGISFYHQGGIRSDLLNSGAVGLGQPNAFLLPRAGAGGKPDYALDVDKAVYVWKDAQNLWHLRAAAGAGASQFSGRISADLPLQSSTGYQLGTEDLLSPGADQMSLDFDFQVAAQTENGLQFSFPDGAIIMLELDDNAATAAALLKIGAAAWPISQLPVDLTR